MSPFAPRAWAAGVWLLVSSGAFGASAVTLEVGDRVSLPASPDAQISLKDARSGRIVYVESGGLKLVALNPDGHVAWIADIAAAARGKPPAPIRNLRLDGRNLEATCGKRDTFVVDVDTGAVRYLGSD